MSIHLFLDTNIWLSFFHLTNDDLEELRKVQVLINQKQLILYLPEQVINEFHRNRESKIANAMKVLKNENLNEKFPQMCKDYDEYKPLRELIVGYKKLKSILIAKLTEDYTNEKLKADKIINMLFLLTDQIALTDEIWHRAKLRYDLGNPPGKSGSYGDAVNWESLLAEVPDGEDIFFVSVDSDFSSSADEDQFSSFLGREWIEKKHAHVRYFKRIADFFKDQFPNIKLAVQLEKEMLIQELVSSPTFVRSRSTLYKLSRFSDFTDDQIDDIIGAAITNSQILWIANDPDISSYLKQITNGAESCIEPKKFKCFEEIFKKDDPNEEAIDD